MPSILPYVQTACVGHPQEQRLLLGLTDDTAACTLVTQCLRGQYNRGRIGTRELLIPDQNLRLSHRALHQVLMPLMPEPVGVHALAAEIHNLLPGYTHFIRTDIAKCFPSVQEKPALASLDQFLTAQGWGGNDASGQLLRTIAHSVFAGGQGLSTGSPASPYLLEVLLRDLPQKVGASRVLRYVDDILILLPKEQAGNHAAILGELSQAISPLGLAFGPAKTEVGATLDGFSFLGRKFGTNQGPSTAYAVNVRQFFGTQHWQPQLALTADAGAPAYDNTRRVTTFRLDTLFDNFMKGSLDALVLLACVKQIPDLGNFSANRELFLSQDFAHPCHSKLYQSYISQVKTPRDQGKRVLPAEAERILVGLALTTFIQKESRFPDDLADMEAALKIQFPPALAEASTGTGAYHTTVKQLFKAEYGLRMGKSLLPATAPILLMTTPPSLAELVREPVVHLTSRKPAVQGHSNEL